MKAEGGLGDDILTVNADVVSILDGAEVFVKVEGGPGEDTLESNLGDIIVDDGALVEIEINDQKRRRLTAKVRESRPLAFRTREASMAAIHFVDDDGTHSASFGALDVRCDLMNVFQIVRRFRLGAGSIPCRLSTFSNTQRRRFLPLTSVSNVNRTSTEGLVDVAGRFQRIVVIEERSSVDCLLASVLDGLPRRASPRRNWQARRQPLFILANQTSRLLQSWGRPIGHQVGKQRYARANERSHAAN